jgi:hypothetical protein
MNRPIILALGALLALVGCKPPQTYEWGNYEGSLYGLMKDPSGLENYGHSLQKQIQDGEGTGKVPPGIYAEYGYFLTATNQSGDAIKYYEKEKQRWPESAHLMDKMISNSRSPRPAQTTTQPATTPLPPGTSVTIPVPPVVVASPAKES